MTGDVYYLSGPMTGYAEFNFPAFTEAATQMRAAGLTVVSPHEIDSELGKPWTTYLRNDIRALMDCTHVAVLPGWQKSDGAQLEVYVAKWLRMPIIPVEYLIEIEAAS